MIGALWTGISGLKAAQTAIDNESNNIANVNTIGYKASRVSFADMMYQDSIGKGASVTRAEKMFTEGSLNQTGNNYDIAIDGDGFFLVSNVSATGTSERYYTRAGNLRMGSNGTLQDANGYEVQGWAMSTLDPDTDVSSTNSNWTNFNDQFTKVAGNAIIKFPTKVETFAAKTTDYETTAKSDAIELSGSGIKNKADKISDVEALIIEYQKALQAYSENPNVDSIPAVSQSSVIQFPPLGTGTNDSDITKEGDTLIVYIDGTQHSIEFKDVNDVSADAVFISEINQLIAAYPALDLDGSGGVAPTVADLSPAEYDILAKRVAMYERMADEISKVTGLNAYTVDSSNNASTSIIDVLAGRIKIDSLLPGDSFEIGDVTETSNGSDKDGTESTITAAVVGSGRARVEEVMQALREAVAGKQTDVYDINSILSDSTGTPVTFDETNNDTLSFEITINGTTYTQASGAAGGTYNDELNALVSAINLDPNMNTTIHAKNVNGNLVIESVGVGEEFSSGILSFVDVDPAPATTYTKDKNIDLSINSGAGAEFMEIVSNVDQETSLTSLQLKLDSLGLTDSAYGEFSVDGSGLITMSQNGVVFVVGQIAIAQFANNLELEAVGDNLYKETTLSGRPTFTLNNENTTEIKDKTLELSNSDLSTSLVNLMVFQRAFEANSKSITTADQLLSTLIDLKR